MMKLPAKFIKENSTSFDFTALKQSLDKFETIKKLNKIFKNHKIEMNHRYDLQLNNMEIKKALITPSTYNNIKLGHYTCYDLYRLFRENENIVLSSKFLISLKYSKYSWDTTTELINNATNMKQIANDLYNQFYLKNNSNCKLWRLDAIVITPIITLAERLVRYETRDVTESKCTICLNDIKSWHYNLGCCSARYHIDCLLQWFETHAQNMYNDHFCCVCKKRLA